MGGGEYYKYKLWKREFHENLWSRHIRKLTCRKHLNELPLGCGISVCIRNW